MEALGEFTSLISGSLSPPSPFDLLPPPATVGFLKLSRPCCYVFPAGRGDCAFFAVNGFTLLVDGGSDPQACFWKLVRHLDRVDAVLVTHAGAENLPGVNVFLERKVAELELSSGVKNDASKRLVSPELGVVFFNAPSRLQTEVQPSVDNVLKSTHQAALTLQLLKKLDIRPQPLFRPQGVPIEPLTLFQKMGVGQLDLYILNPGGSSQEYQTFMQSWPDAAASASRAQAPPLAALASVCALLVWHPACPQEKVVRVLFPGVTPQAKLLQGLDKLRGLAFLRSPAVTGEELEGAGGGGGGGGGPDSRRRRGKEATGGRGRGRGVKEEGREAPGKERGKVVNGGTDKMRSKEKKGGKKEGKKEEKKEEKAENRRDQGKKEVLVPKAKNEDKMKLKKEAKNDTKTGVKKTRKPSGKEATVGARVNAAKGNASKPDAGAEPQGRGAKEPNQSPEKPCASKTSSPDDMTADFLRLREETTAEGDAAGTTGTTGDRGEAGDDDEQRGEKVDRPRGDVVVGFPSPLNRTPKNKQPEELDLTPTEFTLLDGALRSSPPSRSSSDDRPPVSPDEETVGPDSADSRPNSAGHTPYCLSPDDVWCDRAAPSRLQARGGDPGSPDVDRTLGSSKQSDGRPGQPGQPRSAQEGPANPRERSFLSLGTFKDGSSDPSPSVATTTTTTTHSLPAEVSSPQSTEVDESLSMSLEQGPTTAGQREGDDGLHRPGSNGGHGVGVSLAMRKPPRRPPAPNALHFEVSAHDVDLCLVSPCEFKHFKAPDGGEPDPPGGAEDCPSTTADGALDSDEEEESCSEASGSPPRDLRAGQGLPRDPPPVPVRDGPPLAPPPDTSMPVPHSEDHGKRGKTSATQGRKASAATEASPRSGSGKSRSGVAKGNVSSTRTPPSSGRSAPAKPSAAPGSKSPPAGEVSVYVDLAYVPSGAASPTVGADFFGRVRSACYVVSGQGPEREGLLGTTLDALLDSKASWPETMQVTVIPTLESAPMQEWYRRTQDRQRELGVTVLGANSTVAMQDETFPACKIEF